MDTRRGKSKAGLDPSGPLMRTRIGPVALFAPPGAVPTDPSVLEAA